jgi:DNA-binding transcriptional ArsR family regulator
MNDVRAFKAEFFKALAHPVRIAVLDTLRAGEAGVNDLSGQLKVEQSTLSQHLAVLRARNIVVGRKEGLNVFYSVADPAVFKLLDAARQIFNNQLTGVRDMLAQIKREA